MRSLSKPATNVDWMVTGPEREAVAQRALALASAKHIKGTPRKAAHNLGPIMLGNGCTVCAHVVHAVDAVITDGVNVVMINRLKPPGQGLPALPGGFIDPRKGGGAENSIQAAVREAFEEAGIVLTGGRPVGTRNMYRPHDVRTAMADLPAYGIKKGDVFMVSTQAIRFDYPDLAGVKLAAGDDAAPGSARLVRVAALTPDSVGIADHFDMIVAALAPKVGGTAGAAKSGVSKKN